MKKLKPITQWYEQLPEPYRSQALHNYKKYACAHSEQPSIGDAIQCFWWHKTKQGAVYWKDVCRRAENGEFDSKPEAPQPEQQHKPIGLSKETKILISVLLRREFDSLPWYSFEEAAPIIIKAAQELGIDKLAREMRDDLNFDIKNTSHENI